MADTDADLPGDSGADGADDQSDSTTPDSNQQGGTLEQLQAEIKDLRTRTDRNTKLISDFNAAVGRLQSLVAKAESVRGSSDTALKQLKTQMGAVDQALEAMLQDEALDPKIRERAATLRREAVSKSELEQLRDQVAALSAAPAAQTPTHLSLEAALVAEIQSYGLDPDDPAFDWNGQAAPLLQNQGPAAVTAYIRKQIGSLVAAKGAADRRQVRKDAAGGTPKPEDKALSPLDPSRSDEERLKWLVDQGILVR